MSEKCSGDFIVFYAWQSDLPDKTNRRAIRNALKSASISLEEEFAGQKIRIIIDESTRDMSGSPNIPTTILDKIRSADAFVCDITTVLSSAGKSAPNPNVIFELGYAVAYLGWDRIIMLFNREYGKFPDDVPFDFDRNRISQYKFIETDKGKNINLNSLSLDALKLIIEKCPSKPSSQSSIDPSLIKRQRDVANLKWALSCLHLPTVDEFIIQVPHRIFSRSLYFWENFNGVILNPLFSLYDGVVNGYVESFYKAWSRCLSHDEHYHMTNNPDVSLFYNPMDLPLNKRQQKAWNDIEINAKLMRKYLTKLLKCIREKYIDIDLIETNRKAWDSYVDYRNKIDLPQ